MKDKVYNTTYAVAVHWLGNSLIMCNMIPELDDRFEFPELDEDDEIYQYFLTSCSDGDRKFLEEHFGLTFGYSPMLDLHVLCVTHWGTGWDYDSWTTDLLAAECELGSRYERKLVKGGKDE